MHKYAMKAATAALAANKYGKFWQFHDQLFHEYNKLNDEKIREIAGNLGLNTNEFENEMKNPKIALTQSKNGLNGKIIVAEEHDKNMGDHTVAFINKGDQDGVKIGQSYSIYYQEKGELNKKSDREILLTPNILGSLLVLHTEPTTSTVLITRSDRSIDPGAKIFSPVK